MKLRQPNNETTVKVWFDRISPNADDPSLDVYSANNRIMARGHTLYSYGTHFPLVRWLPEHKWFLSNTSERRSSSTSKHQSYVRRHIPAQHIEVGCMIDRDPVTQAASFFELFDLRIRRCLEKARRARSYKRYWHDRAEYHLGIRAKFTRVFGVKAPALPDDLTTTLVTLKLAA